MARARGRGRVGVVNRAGARDRIRTRGAGVLLGLRLGLRLGDSNNARARGRAIARARGRSRQTTSAGVISRLLTSRRPTVSSSQLSTPSPGKQRDKDCHFIVTDEKQTTINQNPTNTTEP